MTLKRKSWRLVGAVAGGVLLMAALAWPPASMAGKRGGGGGGNFPSSDSGRFTCRGSALRIDELLGSVFEPVVANPPEDPCRTDDRVLIGLAPRDDVSADVLGAATEDDKAPVSAEGFAVEADVLGLVSAEVLEATAQVTAVRGMCVLSGESSVASAVVNGTPISLVDGHLEVPLPGVGVVHFNETLGGLNPTSGNPDANRVTQRALWVQITNPLVQQTTGVEEVIVGEATADFEGGNPCAENPPVVNKRRMTGGGNFSDGATTVTHGFVLHCDRSRSPNNLEVNWEGNSFHLETLKSASCTDSPGIDEGQPRAGFDTYAGRGSGRLNGVSGATAEWTFTDAGEPGSNDTARIRILDRNGTPVLDVERTLFKGNHQAHG